MDIQKYIASGILEQYVLGDLSAQQQREVESYTQQYTEIKAELDAIENALENIAQAARITPPAGLEVAILEKIDNSVQSNPDSNTTIPSNNARVHSPFKGLSLLAGLLLLGATIWGFMQYQASTRNAQELQGAKQELQILKEDCDKLRTNQNQNMVFLKDINTKPVQMKGTAKAPDALAVVYWNEDKNEAYLDTGSLPQVTNDNKEYELWAIVKGNPKPISMGVFNKTSNDSAFQKVNVAFTEQPVTFAVTLETKDGNPAPNLEEMYLAGNNT